MRNTFQFKLLLAAILWLALTVVFQAQGHSASEPIEELPRDIVKLGTGIGKLPKSLYSPDRASELIGSAAARLWNFSKPDPQPRVTRGMNQSESGIRIRYAF